MANQYFVKDGFPYIRISCKASELMKELDALVNYNDGQGRSHDIIDEEIYGKDTD